MRIKEVMKTNLIAIYPGRFQPPHRGHFAVYKFLANKFGKHNTYIATSNKTDIDDFGQVFKSGPQKGQYKQVKSPFTFDEKKEIWTNMFGVNSSRIIECENPAFNPTEILNNQPLYTSYVVAVGKKDLERYTKNTWYEELPEDFSELKPFTRGGYYINMNTMEGGLNASKVRYSLSTKQPLERIELFKMLYNKFNADIYTMITKKLVGKYEWQ